MGGKFKLLSTDVLLTSYKLQRRTTTTRENMYFEDTDLGRTPETSTEVMRTLNSIETLKKNIFSTSTPSP